MLKEHPMAVARKKTTAKKKPAKRVTAKRKTTTRKVAARKRTVVKKTTTRKTVARRKPAVKKAAAKKTTARRKAPKRKTTSKRKPNPAFMRPWTLSDELGAVVGMRPMPRTEVTKKLWDYIKKNKLQDAINRRMINADEKLKRVFGGRSKVSMFEMTKLVSKHLK